MSSEPYAVVKHAPKDTDPKTHVEWGNDSTVPIHSHSLCSNDVWNTSNYVCQNHGGQAGYCKAECQSIGLGSRFEPPKNFFSFIHLYTLCWVTLPPTLFDLNSGKWCNLASCYPVQHNLH
jgi:hypothetical protein